MGFSYCVCRSEPEKIKSFLAQLISECDNQQDFSEVFSIEREIHKSKSSVGLQIDVSVKKKERSRPQENYYRKWCGRFANFCGMTPDEMHEEMLCQTFGSEEVDTKMGIRRRPIKRSSGTNTSTYAELIETLVRVSSELGFVVPLPNTREYENG
jgi:hypothetical protein|tara:strand:- start:22246 stop:22707 length:462 start_codon:yes stop_codon:yes gene_type:complete